MADTEATTVAEAAAVCKTININIGILGHVDSGKTSLVKALSTHLSTASLDKHPQSQERGITLDLGFSAFVSDAPPQIASRGYERVQYTLVDCPGHASLIRTIIGGAQIIDMMILVIDVVKGIQTQTAECLVIGEITTDKMIVVLNKVDLLPEAEREKEIEKASARIRKVLASTKFKDCTFVALSAAPGGAGKLGAAAPFTEGVKTQAANVADLVNLIKVQSVVPARSSEGPFLFAIDHCFAIKGQGTVLTGTVLSGTCKVGDTIALPELGQEKKVKSIQMFKTPVNSISEGDRAGICVKGLDAELLERGLACTPGAIPTIHGALALIKKIRFFKGHGESESKFHVTVGHFTVMATLVFFGAAELAAKGVTTSTDSIGAAERDATAVAALEELSLGKDEKAAGAVKTGSRKEIVSSKALPAAESAKLSVEAEALGTAMLGRAQRLGIPPQRYVWGEEFEWQAELLGGRRAKAPSSDDSIAVAKSSESVYEWQWAALLFESPILCPMGALVIGSHLDSDIHANVCRIAFFGRIAEPLPSSDIHELRRCNIYKNKVRVGVVDRIEEVGPPTVLIGRDLFKKETDMTHFIGMTLHTRLGQPGLLESAFGKAGKFRAVFRDPSRISIQAARASVREDPRVKETLPAEIQRVVSGAATSSGDDVMAVSAAAPIKTGDSLYLRHKKYMYEASAKSAAAKAR